MSGKPRPTAWVWSTTSRANMKIRWCQSLVQARNRRITFTTLAAFYTQTGDIELYPFNWRNDSRGIWFLQIIPSLAHELWHWLQWKTGNTFKCVFYNYEVIPYRITVVLNTLLTLPTTRGQWEAARWTLPEYITGRRNH